MQDSFAKSLPCVEKGGEEEEYDWRWLTHVTWIPAGMMETMCEHLYVQ